MDREDAREESKGRVRDETDDDEEIDVFADLPSDVEGEDNGDQKVYLVFPLKRFFYFFIIRQRACGSTPISLQNQAVSKSDHRRKVFPLWK